ncbi:hypothetical protein WN48_05084 [Eufriesea mexicana]|nr:hypothetical protein WN48_05084 [Eufriesea mexicana]
MEEVRGSPARRLSQILDPIARLATDFGSNSAPCSPRLGVRGHEATSVGGGGIAQTGPAAAAAAAAAEVVVARRQQTGAEHANNANNNHAAAIAASGSLSVPVHARDSPYVNVPNLLFQKDNNKGFADAARSAGYVELRDTKPKCSPYDFTSESSGHVEYADKRTFAAQTDFEGSSSDCYDVKDLAAFARARSNFDPGPAPQRSAHFDRAYSFSGRQPEQTGRIFADNRLYVDQRNAVAAAAAASSDAKKEKLESRPAYGSSKSFDGYSSAVEELNWQERCLELQLELHRSRSQATRVRDMLREKVSLFTLLFSFLLDSFPVPTAFHRPVSDFRGTPASTPGGDGGGEEIGRPCREPEFLWKISNQPCEMVFHGAWENAVAPAERNDSVSTRIFRLVCGDQSRQTVRDRTNKRSRSVPSASRPLPDNRCSLFPALRLASDHRTGLRFRETIRSPGMVVVPGRKTHPIRSIPSDTSPAIPG